ncbi:MAG: PIN domain-containing protein [Gemmatimonadetes bacterium]|nr:PIN domain-containing protein [Gemmatimonadota bacterium]
MSVRSFLDSNVLVYTDDRDAPEKQARAMRLVERARGEGWGVLSTQVLQEYFVAATRKLGVPPEIARRKVELFARLDLVLVDLADILGAIDLHRLHSLGFWDGLIVRAALRARCAVLLSENFQAGWQVDGLEVVNPFDA